MSTKPHAVDQPPYAITPIGEHYGGYTAALAAEEQVRAVSAQVEPAPVASTSDIFTATLRLQLGNSGGLAAATAVRGQFCYEQGRLAPPQITALADCGADATLVFT